MLTVVRLTGITCQVTINSDFWGGAFIYTPLSKVMDIQLEIEYNGKGAQSVSTADEGYQTEYTLNLNYVELPVLLRYNTIYNVGIDAGLGFGYLFNPTQSISNFTSNQTSFNHFELSGIIGLEYKLNEKFSTIARFSYSLNPIAKTYTNTNDLFLASGLYNNMITVGICYFFPGT